LSTILKALKRIDHTTPPPEDLQSLPLRINTKETLKARVYKIWLYRKLYLSLILLLAVIAAGWFVYSQKDLLLSKLPWAKQSSDKIPANRNADKVTIYQAKINPNPNQSGSAAKKRTTPSGRKNIRIGTSAEKDHAGANLSSRPLPQMPAQQKIPILTSSDKTGSSGQTPTAIPKISQTQTAGSRKAVQRNPLQSAATSAEKAQAMPTPVSRSYQRLNDDKLKLQAIAWSNEAAQRIAVINGHVVREGESVEGFSVNQIRREDVIVNDGTQSWQLEFSLK
jgi:hypothetical protein